MPIEKEKGGVLISLVVCGLVGGIIFVLVTVLNLLGIYPPESLIFKNHGTVGTTTYESRTQKNLCEYILPEGFLWRSLLEGSLRMGVQVFTRSNSPEQMITLFKLPYHLKVDPSEIQVERKESGKTFYMYDQRIKNFYEMIFQHKREEWFFTLYYYLPFFYARQVPAENRSLILRGMKLKGTKYLETDKTRIWVWYGDFQRIAFDKRQDHRFLHYIVEAIHFNEPKSGAVALIQNKDPQARGVYIQYTNPEWTQWKEIGEVPWDLKETTLFCLTTVKQGEELNQEEFETFLKTINFNAKVYNPFVMMRYNGVKFQVK